MIKIDIKDIRTLNGLNNYLRSNKINLILFGETHGFLEESRIQNQILQKIKCDILLYELLETTKLPSLSEKNSFLSTEDDKDFSIISKYGELKPLVSLSKKYDLPIIGCDLKNMGRKDNSFLTRKNWTKEELKSEDDLMKKRERKHYEVIKAYLNKNKRLFVSIGFYHIRPSSLLMKLLGDQNFIIIYPMLKSGEFLGENINFDKKDIFYKVQAKSKYLQNE